jgi:hypothetical protein
MCCMSAAVGLISRAAGWTGAGLLTPSMHRRCVCMTSGPAEAEVNDNQRLKLPSVVITRARLPGSGGEL